MVTVRVALGTAAPDWSDTVPTSVAVTDCARSASPPGLIRLALPTSKKTVQRLTAALTLSFSITIPLHSVPGGVPSRRLGLRVWQSICREYRVSRATGRSDRGLG